MPLIHFNAFRKRNFILARFLNPRIFIIFFVVHHHFASPAHFTNHTISSNKVVCKHLHALILESRFFLFLLSAPKLSTNSYLPANRNSDARLHRTLLLQLKRLHRYDGTIHDSKLARQRRLLSIRYRYLMKSHSVATTTTNSSSRSLFAINAFAILRGKNRNKGFHSGAWGTSPCCLVLKRDNEVFQEDRGRDSLLELTCNPSGGWPESGLVGENGGVVVSSTGRWGQNFLDRSERRRRGTSERGKESWEQRRRGKEREASGEEEGKGEKREQGASRE
ncbi:hypothetical protein MRB53_032993 [Persea americana]|uniref:Uncharacterized protein n=1 Tax=Persea americana TaxID=3435 RepID=A0ACC2KTZ6_PERAE|nr:hypothetical protein MRB53_032993 [Persea americana]